MYDIIAIGELLIDFTPAGISDTGMPLLAQNPGGAPANVLSCAAKAGLKTAMIGKVGNDSFGKFLMQVLDDHLIDTRGLVMDSDVETTLAFVHLSADGDRDFSFYRTKGADKFLSAADINYTMIDNSRILHFGSLSLTDEPSRSSTLEALSYAQGKGKIISYDPNWRPPLWSGKEEGIRWMKKGLSYAHVVKMSEDELALLTDHSDMPTGIHIILDQNPLIKILAVTLGKDGCIIANRQEIQKVPGVSLMNGKPLVAIDATGAGDCFTGSLLACILKNNIDLNHIGMEQLAGFARYANHAAALCVTKKGGIPSMPAPEQVDEFPF